MPTVPEQSVIVCPHCKEYIVIQELNCGIFRHGVIKTTGEQVPSHASKEECEAYIQQDLIYGCGKPFEIRNQKIRICGYI